MLNYFFYLTVLSFSMGQFSSLLKESTTNLYLFDVFILIFSLVSVVFMFIHRKKLILPLRNLFIVLFGLTALLSFVFNYPNYSSEENFTASLYLLRMFSYIFYALIIYNLIQHRILNVSRVLGALTLSAVFLAGTGFVQLIILPDFTVLDPNLGWDPHQNRLAGVFYDPNFCGAYLVIGLFSNYLWSNFHFHKKLTLFISIFLLLALLLTFSRSAWLMFSLLLLLFGIFKSPKVLFISFLLLFATYYAVPRVQTRLSGATDPSDSASLRLISWQNSWTIIQDYWLLGVGYNHYRSIQKDYSFLDPDTITAHHSAGADSSLLFIWATTGIFGLLYFVNYLIFMRGKSIVRETTFLLILPLLANSFFINSLLYPQILFAVISLLAAIDVFNL